MSHSATERVSESDRFENLLVHGDNLLALKALEQRYSGHIKCVYIDPPFNTGQAFEHYDDGVEHSLWLDLMSRRLCLLHRLLRDDGVLFVHLDQEEVHYLKVVLDELFGRAQFLGQIAYERSGVSGIGQGGAFLVNTHEYILAYAKDRSKFSASSLEGDSPLEQKAMKRYNRVLVSPGSRVKVDSFVAPSTGQPVEIYKHEGQEVDTISLRNFDKRCEEIEVTFAENFETVFRLTSIQKENSFQNKILSYCQNGFYSADYLVSRGKRSGQNVTAYYCDGQAAVWLKDTARLADGKVVRTGKLSDFWTHADIPKANLANEGGVAFRRGKKPEVLIKRLLRLVTNPGDWVLDSFAGSGTTGAVAHKMGRRWIMVELGDHCLTHIVPRLRSVIDGKDTSGVTSDVSWKGGGGFRFVRLAPSLLELDKWGNWVINKTYNKEMLAEAMCKLEGFTYAPSPNTFWQHGQSTERDFIYVTTQTLTHEQLQVLNTEVGPDRTLLICCSAFRADLDEFSSLTVTKIPATVLSRCEWGQDDYSLNVENVLSEELGPEPEDEATDEQAVHGSRRKKAPAVQELSLFEGAPDQ